MKFIAERGEWLNNGNFLKKQVDNFFSFSWNDGKSRSFEGNKHWQRFIRWVSSVKDSSVSSILKETLLSIAKDECLDGWLRRSCIDAVGKSGVKDNQVVTRLLTLAEDEMQYDVLRGFCAEAIEKL